jgi:hypothetical protein
MADHSIAIELMRGAAEIAEFIGFPKPVTTRLLWEGALPAFQVGKIWCMRQSTYILWVERLEPPFPPKPPPFAMQENSNADEPGDVDRDQEVATFPPGRYYQKTLANGRVALWRRASASKPLTAREQRFREIDQSRAQREAAASPPLARGL